MRSEKDLEELLVKKVHDADGICPKFVSPGTNGMPDRIVLMPGGNMCFVEVKAKGQQPRRIQLRRHARLRALGFKVYVLDDPDQIPAIIQSMEGENNGTSLNNQ